MTSFYAVSALSSRIHLWISGSTVVCSQVDRLGDTSGAVALNGNIF